MRFFWIKEFVLNIPFLWDGGGDGAIHGKSLGAGLPAARPNISRFRSKISQRPSYILQFYIYFIGLLVMYVISIYFTGLLVICILYLISIYFIGLLVMCVISIYFIGLLVMCVLSIYNRNVINLSILQVC